MAKPKLALIPSAQGSKFYSVLPSSGVGDFDFTRSGSATRINSQGLIETVGNGVSRLNYPMIDGKVVGCPSHILEPQRTNLATYSEDFTQGFYSKVNSTVTSNTEISPDGTQNADTFTATSTAGNMQGVVSGTAGQDYTISIWVKRKTGTGNVKLRGIENVSTLINATDEWQRFTLTENSSNGLLRVGVLLDTSGDEVYVWGAQLEQGSYPTSYIPTNGSTVTRSAETANGSGDASTFNDSEGVLMAEISGLNEADTSPRVISLSDGGGANRVMFFISLNEIVTSVQVGGVTQSSLRYELQDTKDFAKVSLKYKTNDFSLWINGFEVEVDTSGNTLSADTLNRLGFDSGYGIEDFYGNTKQIQYYDSALQDSELETLTSWTSFTDMANGQLYTIE